jgi:hypothetical protein
MHVFVLLSAVAAIRLAGPAHAHDPGVEFGFMPRTMTVKLLNEGGKYVAIDLKHIPEGGTCRMDQDATIMRVGAGTTPGTILVRYAAPQISSGGCPFLTLFELSNADYSAARSSFLGKEAAAKQMIDDLKKQLGDKWDELMGKKS